MICLKCANYTVVAWNWIDCSSLNISVCLYIVGWGPIERLTID